MTNRSGNEKDAKRVGLWLSIVIGLLVLGAVTFNVFWLKKAPANVDNAPKVEQRTTAPSKPPGS